MIIYKIGIRQAMRTESKIFIIFFLLFSASVQICYSQKGHDVVEEITKQDTTEKKSKFNGYPYLFYTPETELALGAGGIFIFYTGREANLQPSKIGFGGYYSTNGQYKINMNNVYYFWDNKLYFSLPLSYGKFINRFYGIGNDTPSNGDASYELETFTATMSVQTPPILFQADRAGLILDYNNSDIIDKRENKQLIDENVTGSDGGEIFGIGYELVWDSRDNIFFPNNGGYQYFKTMIYPDFSDFLFGIVELDVRQYFAFSPDHVLASNFFLQTAGGDTPFYKLPALGGQKRMRGYFFGRYQDNVYMTFQMEYRQYFWKKFGFVAFGGLGNVASDMLSYDFGSLKPSYGGGLRYQFNDMQKINLRADIGFGTKGNMGIYFGIEEAF